MSTLYIVATPIGNLDDISARAAEVLAAVDMIACEDTRRTGQLLKHLSVSTRMMALHDHNEEQLSSGLIEAMTEGQSVALVSDAGTPLISDPGYHLVRLCHSAGISVVPVPGPSAVMAALSAAGIPTDRFTFEGFVPAKKNARQNYFRALKSEPRTMVMFEAPHRIEESLRSLVQEMGGDRVMTVCRELTKTYEQIIQAPIDELLNQVVTGEIPAKGEFALVMSGSPDAVVPDVDQLLAALLQELSPSKAAAVAATLTDHPKSVLYERALALKN